MQSSAQGSGALGSDAVPKPHVKLNQNSVATTRQKDLMRMLRRKK
jgi:hypothetical protein